MKNARKLMNNSNTLLMITSIYTSLTKAEKKVADAVQQDPENAVLATVTDLAEKAGVGETSVIRFCRKLGFKGYHEFKLTIAQNLVSMPEQVNGRIDETDDVSVIARKITANNERTLQNTLDLLRMDDLKEAAERIISANRILVFGVGSSGITALDAHYRFMRLGIRVEVERDSHIIAMKSSLVKPGDVVIGISTSGSTKDLVDSVKRAKENGANIICLTGHVKSPITTYADTILVFPSKEMPAQGGSLSAKVAQIHLLDILSTVLSIKMKETAYESVKKTANAVVDKLY